jgi:hypothetical protein
MLKKIKRLWKIIRYFFKDEDGLFFYLMELKAYKCLDECYKLHIRHTEELEDLIFHLKSYYSIPDVVAVTKYPEFKGISIKEAVEFYKKKKLPIEEVKRFGDYLEEIEEMRAVERDFIFDYAKILTFGFTL